MTNSHFRWLVVGHPASPNLQNLVGPASFTDCMTGKCPYCEEEITPVSGGEPQDHSGIATVWICPICEKILSVSEWMD